VTSSDDRIGTSSVDRLAARLLLGAAANARWR
jgi:hypothetical protein